ncbi:DUF3492 domain-containing protein [Legionella israelensis]|uniref:DUF3492 domain-containing protein n=1 Tax=Legionella israelensis TaxID=454 RepID=A0AAX1EFB5_9GAMM|nr:GT4 family glycosyltransferase PelF [Legionella israelensis]QBR83796.1 DUF3492 domain-containing protein [Legionella israelensis]
MIETRFSCEKVDILLVSEGSFPFVKGGVSSWISDLITHLPEYRFGVIFLGAYPGLYNKSLFPIPDNLGHLQIVYLFPQHRSADPGKDQPTEQALNAIKQLHDVFKRSHGYIDGLVEPIKDLAQMMSSDEGFDFYHFLRSEQAWKILTEQYSRFSTDPSFIDYFWNIRNMHEPLWQLQPAVDNIPHTQILQSASTGYAGLLAAMLQQRYDYPFVLSEHGLYSKERNIELLQSNMFAERNPLISNKKNFSYQHHLWINFFDSLARTAYNQANKIISLFEAARNQQLASGAREDKTEIVPNGIDIKKYAPFRRSPEDSIPKIVCFVGRIIRIKDIKTLIRASALMVSKDKNIRIWIKSIGNEDPVYLRECEDYVQLLSMEEYIQFIYEGGMLDMIAGMGILMLSSISEGMPLVVLESMAAGIPVVTTDVGSCRDIIEGRDKADKALGTAGCVVSVLDASALAEAAVMLLNDRQKWQQASEAGIQRVETYYNQKTMVSAYRKIYQEVS